MALLLLQEAPLRTLTKYLWWRKLPHSINKMTLFNLLPNKMSFYKLCHNVKIVYIVKLTINWRIPFHNVSVLWAYVILTEIWIIYWGIDMLIAPIPKRTERGKQICNSWQGVRFDRNLGTFTQKGIGLWRVLNSGHPAGKIEWSVEHKFT